MNNEYIYLPSSVQLNTMELIICKKISGELLCPCLITSHRTNLFPSDIGSGDDANPTNQSPKYGFSLLDYVLILKAIII